MSSFAHWKTYALRIGFQYALRYLKGKLDTIWEYLSCAQEGEERLEKNEYNILIRYEKE